MPKKREIKYKREIGYDLDMGPTGRIIGKGEHYMTSNGRVYTVLHSAYDEFINDKIQWHEDQFYLSRFRNVGVTDEEL